MIEKNNIYREAIEKLNKVANVERIDSGIQLTPIEDKFYIEDIEEIVEVFSNTEFFGVFRQERNSNRDIILIELRV